MIGGPLVVLLAGRLLALVIIAYRCVKISLLSAGGRLGATPGPAGGSPSRLVCGRGLGCRKISVHEGPADLGFGYIAVPRLLLVAGYSAGAARKHLIVVVVVDLHGH